jgi:hypothetical protein
MTPQERGILPIHPCTGISFTSPLKAFKIKPIKSPLYIERLLLQAYLRCEDSVFGGPTLGKRMANVSQDGGSSLMQRSVQSRMRGMTPDQDLMGDGIDPNKSIGMES